MFPFSCGKSWAADVILIRLFCFGTVRHTKPVLNEPLSPLSPLFSLPSPTLRPRFFTAIVLMALWCLSISPPNFVKWTGRSLKTCAVKAADSSYVYHVPPIIITNHSVTFVPGKDRVNHATNGHCKYTQFCQTPGQKYLYWLQILLLIFVGLSSSPFILQKVGNTGSTRMWHSSPPVFWFARTPLHSTPPFSQPLDMSHGGIRDPLSSPPLGASIFDVRR